MTDGGWCMKKDGDYEDKKSTMIGDDVSRRIDWITLKVKWSEFARGQMMKNHRKKTISQTSMHLINAVVMDRYVVDNAVYILCLCVTMKTKPFLVQRFIFSLFEQ